MFEEFIEQIMMSDYMEHFQYWSKLLGNTYSDEVTIGINVGNHNVAQVHWCRMSEIREFYLL